MDIIYPPCAYTAEDEHATFDEDGVINFGNQGIIEDEFQNTDDQSSIQTERSNDIDDDDELTSEDPESSFEHLYTQLFELLDEDNDRYHSEDSNLDMYLDENPSPREIERGIDTTFDDTIQQIIEDADSLSQTKYVNIDNEVIDEDIQVDELSNDLPSELFLVICFNSWTRLNYLCIMSPRPYSSEL